MIIMTILCQVQALVAEEEGAQEIANAVDERHQQDLEGEVEEVIEVARDQDIHPTVVVVEAEVGVEAGIENEIVETAEISIKQIKNMKK